MSKSRNNLEHHVGHGRGSDCGSSERQACTPMISKAAGQACKATPGKRLTHDGVASRQAAYDRHKHHGLAAWLISSLQAQQIFSN